MLASGANALVASGPDLLIGERSTSFGKRREFPSGERGAFTSDERIESPWRAERFFPLFFGKRSNFHSASGANPPSARGAHFVWTAE